MQIKALCAALTIAAACFAVHGPAAGQQSTCKPGYTWMKHGLGASCVKNAAPGTTAPVSNTPVTCADLQKLDQARLEALGRESVANNFLISARNDLDNANAAGHYDAAGRVQRWQSAYDNAHNDNQSLMAQEDAAVNLMRKQGKLDPNKCPGMAALKKPAH